MPPIAAVTVVAPALTGMPNPSEPAALLTVATPGAEELQVANVVRFCVVLSEKVPMAVNCCSVSRAMLGIVGLTAMDTSVALVTVNVALPEIRPDVAVMVALPAATGMANPFVPTTVTRGFEVLQVTSVVRFCVVLSE